MIIKRFSETNRKPWRNFTSWLLSTLGIGALFNKYFGGKLWKNMFASAIITSCAYYILSDMAAKRRMKEEEFAKKLGKEDKQELLKNIDKSIKENLPSDVLEKIIKASKLNPNWGDGDEYLTVELPTAQEIAEDIIKNPGKKHLIFYLAYQNPELTFYYDGKYWYCSDYKRTSPTRINWSGVIKEIKNKFDNNISELNGSINDRNLKELENIYGQIIKTLM